MGFMDKMKNLVGIEDEYDEDFEISQEEIDRFKLRPSESESDYSNREEPLNTGISHMAFTEVAPPISSSNNSYKSDIKASMNQSSPFKMIVIEPKSIEECKKLIDNLRARKPVIVNLERVETELARRMFDFLGGATTALEGTVQRVSQNIFVFAPNNVNINAKIDRSTDAGKPENSNPWK